MIQININKEEKRQMMEEIHYFFKEEYELDLGLIGQAAVLDFFLEHLGKSVYNTALDDAKKFYERQRDNMEADFYMLYQQD